MPRNRVPDRDRPEFKRRLIALLGKGNARANIGKILAYHCRYDSDGSYRQTRMMIRELISDGMPIAASTGKPKGYFIAETREEVVRYAKVLKDRLIEDALRRRDFLRAARFILQPDQLKMDV